MASSGVHQIGEVADAVGLSIRTIRHYDEIGVVTPSGRSAGGFRLYTDDDVDRLRFVKRLKPLQFSLEEIQELLASLEAHRAGGSGADRLGRFLAVAEERCAALRDQVQVAEGVVAELRDAVAATPM